jgi:hypothetical protein
MFEFALISPEHSRLVTPEPTLFNVQDPEGEAIPEQVPETDSVAQTEIPSSTVDLFPTPTAPETPAFNIPFEMQQNIEFDKLDPVEKLEPIGVQFTSVTTKFYDSKLNITAKGFLSSQPQETYKSFRSVQAPKSKTIG